MIANRGIARRGIAAGVVLGLLGGFSLFAGTAAASATETTTPAESAAAAELTLSAARGATLRSGQDLVLTGSLTNTGSATLQSGVLEVRVESDLSNRAQLRSAFADPGSVKGPVVAAIQTQPVASGAVSPVTVIVPAATVTGLLAAGGWGPHALAATLDVSGTTEAETSSALVWADGAPPSTVQATVVLPVTVAPGQSGILTADELTAETAPSGPLSRKLEALSTSPATVIALDPRIVASIRVLGANAPASAVEWLDQLESLPNAVIPLQYADADLSLERIGGAASPLSPLSLAWALDPAAFAAPATSTPSPDGTAPSDTPAIPEAPTLEEAVEWSYSAEDVAWPSSDSVSAADLPFLSAAGFDRVVLSSSNVASTGRTHDAVAQLRDMTALISDADISAELSEAAFADTEAESQQAASMAAAELAAVATEAPGQDRTVLITLDRAGETASTSTSTTLSTFRSLPGVVEAGSAILTAAAGASAVTLIDSVRPGAEVAQTLLNQDARISPYASVIAQPELLIGRERGRLLSVLSAGWAADPAGWTTAVGETSTHFDEVLHAVTVVRGSPITAVGNFDSVPIYVRNDLGYPVQVNIDPRPSNGRVIMQPVSATIEPGESQRVFLPTKWIANGTVTIGIVLSSASTGLQIDGPSYLSLDVQAYWETAVLAVTAVLVVGLFGFGIYRNVARRRRRAAEAETDPATDPPIGPSEGTAGVPVGESAE